MANVQLSNLANAGDSTVTEGGSPSVVGNYTVTLALAAPDIERVTNALEYGKYLAGQAARHRGRQRHQGVGRRSDH